VLMRRSILDTVAGFDEQFNLSGGEDTHFFLRVRESGHTMVWSREAVVREAICAERANIAWILRRGYQSGNSWVHCEAALARSSRIWSKRPLKAVAHVLRGLASLPFSTLAGKSAVVWSLRDICLGAGMLGALLGHRFSAYRKSGPASAQSSAEISSRI
jgi:succinoglycan biosynthesis protein ExoM